MIDNPSLIEIDDSSIANVASNSSLIDGATLFTIRIYDNQGTLLSITTRSGKSFSIPLNNLRDGIYIVEVNDGKNASRQQLVVKRN